MEELIREHQLITRLANKDTCERGLEESMELLHDTITKRIRGNSNVKPESQTKQNPGTHKYRQPMKLKQDITNNGWRHETTTTGKFLIIIEQESGSLKKLQLDKQ